MADEKRLSRRHFLKLPIHYRAIGTVDDSKSDSFSPVGQSQTSNVSEGGLLFLAPQNYPSGTIFELTFPVKEKLFTLRATVIHSMQDVNTGLYRTGVRFSNPSQFFRIKMAEQLCHIEEYRESLSQQTGKSISEEEAAERWINDHSKEFADFYTKSSE